MSLIIPLNDRKNYQYDLFFAVYIGLINLETTKTDGVWMVGKLQ
ncbi:hypothetical protein [Thiomicrorhabdus hydrogeniphila]